VIMLQYEFVELLGREARPSEYEICNAVYMDIPDISKQDFVGKYLNKPEELLDFLLKSKNTEKDLKREARNALKQIFRSLTRMYSMGNVYTKNDFDEFARVFSNCLGEKEVRYVIIDVVLSACELLSSKEVVDVLNSYMSSEQ